MIAVQGKPGATERKFCRPQSMETTFTWAGQANGSTPVVHFWRCRPCGHQRMALADMSDAEGFVRTVVNAKLRSTGSHGYGDERSLDYDDIVSEGTELLWSLYVKWKPDAGLTFTSYASYYLPLRLVRWWRQRFGASGNKPLASAISMDGSQPGDESGGGVLAALETGRGDGGEGGDAFVLRGLVERVDRRTLEVARRNGHRPAEGAARGAARPGSRGH